MADRHYERVTKLVRIRQHAEDALRRQFEEARGRAEAIRQRIGELEARLVQHNRVAREQIAAGGRQPTAAYRMSVSVLRGAIAEQFGELRRAEEVLDRCRRELREAAALRTAAGQVQGRLVAKRSAAHRRAETGLLDDLHAARAAVEEGEATC